MLGNCNMSRGTCATLAESTCDSLSSWAAGTKPTAGSFKMSKT